MHRPTSIKCIDNYESQIKSSKKSLSLGVNTISLIKHALDKTITDRPDILSIVDKGKAKISELHGPQLPPGTPPGTNQKHIGHDHDGDGIPDH